MAIILDAMGSDAYPEPEIQAAIEAVKLFQEEIILVGNRDIVEPRLKAVMTEHMPIRIVHAPDVVEMSDKVVDGTKKKPLNSMAVGMELLKSGEGRAFVTAGNTGAVMFNALKKLGRIKGVNRPALTALFPVKTGKCVVLDIGANADCRPEFLLQFAILGSVYAEKYLKVKNPRVGLLSNGEEPGKGNELVKNSYHLLADCGINFVGNLEGKELFGGYADVCVTDGFTGNILLKSSEAVASLINHVLKQELMKSPIRKFGALLAKPAFLALKRLLDPAEVGAAILLGIDGLVLVGHGRSDARAILSAIRSARNIADSDLVQALQKAIQERLADITPQGT